MFVWPGYLMLFNRKEGTKNWWGDALIAVISIAAHIQINMHNFSLA